jgi:hypothetical protein
LNILPGFRLSYLSTIAMMSNTKAHDLAISNEIYYAVTENTYNPAILWVIIHVAAWTLLLLSALSIVVIFSTRSSSRHAQAGDSTNNHTDTKHDDQRPMLLSISFILLLLPLISLAQQSLSYHAAIILWLIGLTCMWSLAHYLNPELATNHYWKAYLFCSSIGFTLLLVHQLGETRPVLIELCLLFSFGITACLMLPMRFLSRCPDRHQQEEQLRGEQGRQSPESEPPLPEITIDLVQEDKQAGSHKKDEAQRPSRPGSKLSTQKRKGGRTRGHAAKKPKYNWLQYFTT